jgi:hypothetical protein
VWAARSFGLDLTAEQWKAVQTFSTNGAVPPATQKILDEAQRIADEHKFFHWELAFPEIFFNADGTPKENSGFDAVIGNPPYVRQERIQPIKPYLATHYAVYSGTADLFLYFYERGLQFVKDAHRLGYITSGTYMNSNSAKPFREYIHDNAGMEWVANFGENQPFRGAEMVYPTIVVLRNGNRRETFRNQFIEGNVPFADLQNRLETGEWVDSLSEATSMDEWRFQSAGLTRLFKKMRDGGTTLGEIVGNNIYRGVTTGFNDAFVIDTPTRNRLILEHATSAALIKPLRRGQDLRPWYQMQNDLYLIFTRRGIDIDNYPAIRRYLEQFRTQLEPKPPDWTGKDWKGRKEGSYLWYEIQDQTAYYEVFDGSKILWPDIAKLPRFSKNEGFYLGNTAFVIGQMNYSLLAILQSQANWFAISQIATPLRLRADLWQYRVLPQFVERLPIPDLSAEQESGLAAIAEEITGLAHERYALHEDFRRTLVTEFGGDAISTRVALYRWWEIADEKALSDEIKRQLGHEIPLSKRSEWRGFLADETAKHAGLTAQIITLETRMNAIVYDAFNLTPEERRLIEETTKYPYGEV